MKKTITVSQDDNRKVISVDGIVFDWGIDDESLEEAKRFAASNPIMKKSIHADIQQHFIQSFSEFIGEEVTLSQLNSAIITGVIECK